MAGVQFPGWHPHLDTWVLLGAVELVYLLAVRRHRPPTGRGQVAAFTAGVVVLWLASDWPVHDVAEGYLYSVHMVQHLLFTLAAAPLLLLGTPAWLARRVLGVGGSRSGPTWRLRVVRSLAKPVPGLIQFNLVLVLSHLPMVVEATVRHHALHFVAHAVLLVSALLMWMVVVSPIPEVPRARPPTQMLYLFLQTIVPTVPASFLTLGDHPLYRIYARFPRLWGIPALTDQQMAGLIMKILGGLYLWTVIAVIFFRWYDSEEKKSEPDGEVLLWEDVEQELRQLDGGTTKPRDKA